MPIKPPTEKNNNNFFNKILFIKLIISINFYFILKKKYNCSETNTLNELAMRIVLQSNKKAINPIFNVIAYSKN